MKLSIAKLCGIANERITRSTGGMKLTEEQVRTRRKSAPLLLCPPQIPHTDTCGLACLQGQMNH